MYESRVICSRNVALKIVESLTKPKEIEMTDSVQVL